MIPATIPDNHSWCSKPNRRVIIIKEYQENSPSGTDLKSDLIRNLRANERLSAKHGVFGIFAKRIARPSPRGRGSTMRGDGIAH